MEPLRAVVCTQRPPARIAACLAALAAQGAPLLLVVSGLDAAAAAAHARALAPGAELVHEPAPGLARARNAALARARGDEEILCFVDDDALVGEGWLAAMREAWAQAPPRTACLGGPIRARFEAARPAWLTDALLPGLTVLDHGPRALALDPRERTVYGANVSFRAGPLRAAGGFDTAFGHAGARVYFGEEDAAERALHAAGYEIRYDPRPWVWHVIPPDRARLRALARRRFAYGLVLGRRRARPVALATRACARAALGAPLALARGDAPGAAERLVRAVENAGALAGRASPPVDARGDM